MNHEEDSLIMVLFIGMIGWFQSIKISLLKWLVSKSEF